MTIAEAIGLLTILEKPAILHLPPNTLDAIKLGIEAMKREQYNRIHHLFPVIGLLPGETKD